MTWDMSWIQHGARCVSSSGCNTKLIEGVHGVNLMKKFHHTLIKLPCRCFLNSYGRVIGAQPKLYMHIRKESGDIWLNAQVVCNSSRRTQIAHPRH
jgi:hypothetical protein